MMMHLSQEILDLYKKLDEVTDKKEIEKINAKIDALALKEREKYKNLPFD